MQLLPRQPDFRQHWEALSADHRDGDVASERHLKRVARGRCTITLDWSGYATAPDLRPLDRHSEEGETWEQHSLAGRLSLRDPRFLRRKWRRWRRYRTDSDSQPNSRSANCYGECIGNVDGTDSGASKNANQLYRYGAIEQECGPLQLGALTAWQKASTMNV